LNDLDDQVPTLVTGASGHIGANLVRALLGRNRRVRALVHKHASALDGLPVEIVRADLLDGAAVLQACAGTGTVFHLAGKISAGWERAEDVYAGNVTCTRNVVEACLAGGVRRLVHFSSIQALLGKGVLNETSDLVASTDRTRGVYDRAKAEAERLVLCGVERGLNAVVLNPTGVLGPFDFQRSPMGEVLVALGKGKLPALVKGASCDFVDVRDVADGALFAESRGRCGERYILSGTRLSLVELALQWAGVTGRAAPRFAVSMGLARSVAHLAPIWAHLRGQKPLFTSESLRVLRTQLPACRIKAESELGFQPRPISETLHDTYAWMKAEGLL
jgi:dihydroflavonol-4-reductase